MASAPSKTFYGVCFHCLKHPTTMGQGLLAINSVQPGFTSPHSATCMVCYGPEITTGRNVINCSYLLHINPVNTSVIQYFHRFMTLNGSCNSSQPALGDTNQYLSRCATSQVATSPDLYEYFEYFLFPATLSACRGNNFLVPTTYLHK